MSAARSAERLSFSRRQMALAGLLFAMTVLNYLDRQALSVVAPLLRRELGLSPVQYSYAVSAFLAAYALMYTGSGVVLDRIGYRSGLAWFVAAWSLFSCLHAGIGGFAHLVAFRFLLGMAEPGGLTGAVKTVARHFNAAQRALATGIFIAGTGLGSLIAPPLIVFLSVHYGWRTAFFLAGAAGLVWVPVWLAVTRGDTAAAPPEPPRRLAEVLAVLRDPRVRAYVAARFFGDGLAYFLMFWVPEYLVSSKHFSFAMIGLVGWIPFLGSDTGALLGGYYSGRLVQSGRSPLFSRKAMMSVAAGFVLCGAALQGAQEVWLVLGALSLCTLGAGIWAANSHSIPGDGFPHRVVATVHGLGGSVGAAGGVVLNALVGYFSGRGDYATVFAILAALQPLGVSLLWWRLRETKPYGR